MSAAGRDRLVADLQHGGVETPKLLAKPFELLPSWFALPFAVDHERVGVSLIDTKAQFDGSCTHSFPVN